jgi:hypothetical protein
MASSSQVYDISQHHTDIKSHEGEEQDNIVQDDNAQNNHQEKDWTCRRCHHPSSTKGNLLKHLGRKQPCIATFDRITITAYIAELTEKPARDKMYQCTNCDKQYTTRQARHKHKQTCKAKQDNDKNDKQIVMKADDLQQLLSRIEVLERRNGIQNVQNTIITNTGNQYNIQNQTQYQININNFGSENTSYLTSEFLSYCLINPRKGMTELIDKIHYNNEFPENQNIRCKSLKQNVFEKYIDSEWRACDASNTLDELIRKGYRILNTHYTDNFMNDPELIEDEIKQRAYERFRYLSDTTCNDYFAVKREVRLLVKDRTMYLIASPEQLESIE